MLVRQDANALKHARVSELNGALWGSHSFGEIVEGLRVCPRVAFLENGRVSRYRVEGGSG